MSYRFSALALALAVVGVQGPAHSAELPVPPARVIEFDTDVGTWMSLDVSPNGKTIVFDHLGDLYTVPVTGGEARRLTGGMQWDGQPRYSPDGREVLLVSDRDGSEGLWAVSLDGSHWRQLVREENRHVHSRGLRLIGPDWFADGKRIAYRQYDAPSNREVIFVLDLASGERRKLEFIGIPTSPSIAPDGRSVYASVSTSNHASRGVWRVARVELESNEQTLVTQPRRHALRPVISPDGTKLVYVTRVEGHTRLVVRDLASGDERYLPGDVQEDRSWTTSDIDHFPGYAFLPDGRALVVTAQGKFWKIDVATGGRTAIPLFVHVRQELAPLQRFAQSDNQPQVSPKQVRWPQLSPDRRFVVFEAIGRLWSYEVEKQRSVELRVGGHSLRQPRWTADGKSILYVSADSTGRGYAASISANRDCLTEGRCASRRFGLDKGYYRNPVDVPGGKSIVVLRSSDRDPSESELVAFSPADSTATVLAKLDATKSVGIWGVPHFIAGEERVYLYDASWLPPLDGLVSVPLKAGIRTNHLKVKTDRGFHQTVYAAQLSPDGKYFLLADERGVLLVPRPASGTFPQELSVSAEAQASGGIREIDRLGGDFVRWLDEDTFYYSRSTTLFVHDLALEGKTKARRERYSPQRIDIRFSVPRDKPNGVLALRNARIVTMAGDQVIERGDVLIRDNLIAAVGRHGEIPIPSSARIFDLDGKTILPGFIDLHGHILPFLRNGIIDDEPETLAAYLAYGVTAIREPAPHHRNGEPDSSVPAVFDVQARLAAGRTLGPRLLSTGPAIAFNLPDIRTAQDADVILRRYSKEFWDTGTVKLYDNRHRATRQLMTAAARSHGLMPTAEGAIEYGMTMVLDGYPAIEHNYAVHSPLREDAVQLIARSGTMLDPTIVAANDLASGSYFPRNFNAAKEEKLRRFLPFAEVERDSNSDRYSTWYREELYLHPGIARDMAAIIRAGGEVGVGSHGNIPGFGFHHELWAFESGGIPRHDILKAATLHGAKALGLERELGSVESGKLADLQVLTANPLTDMHNSNTVELVVKNGRLYRADTLQELWPRSREFPAPWWQRADPAPEWQVR